MCLDPASMMIFSLLGTGIQAMGAIQQGNAAQASADYNAQVAQQNAAIAERNAADARNRGIVAEQDQQRKTQQMLGQQRAVMADRFTDMGSGSALEILGDTAMYGKLDALTVRNNFEREAIGHETQRMNYVAKAELSSLEGENARKSGMISAFSSLAGGVGNMRRLELK